MINFFRKIRKELADDNKPLKYARYAIGEIVLVVIGILIALSINNWNERQVLHKKVSVQLQNLSLGLQNDIRMLYFHKDANETRFHSWQHILKYAERDSMILSELPWSEDNRGGWQKPLPIEKNEDFALIGIHNLSRAFLPPPMDRSAFEEMKSIGLFSEIRDEKLKKDINRFYFLLELYLGATNNKIGYELAQELTGHLRNKYGISVFQKTKADFVFNAFTNDDNAYVMLTDLIYYAHDQHGKIVNLINRGDRLLIELNSQIVE
jgi:hypothetical protein